MRAKTAELCAMSSGSAGQRQPSCVCHVVWSGKVSSLLAEISPRDVEEKIKENREQSSNPTDSFSHSGARIVRARFTWTPILTKVTRVVDPQPSLLHRLLPSSFFLFSRIRNKTGRGQETKEDHFLRQTSEIETAARTLQRGQVNKKLPQCQQRTLSCSATSWASYEIRTRRTLQRGQANKKPPQCRQWTPSCSTACWELAVERQRGPLPFPCLQLILQGPTVR